MNQQEIDDGVGTLFERRYWVDVQQPNSTPKELMLYIKANFPDFSPKLLANFQVPEDEELSLGDTVDIHILGPWDGSVRVSDIDPYSIEFVTLEGHPEAGRIRFKARWLDAEHTTLRFEIRSLARSRDGLVAFAHETLGVGMWVQGQAWKTFCARVAKHLEGQTLGRVQHETCDVMERDWWLHQEEDEE